MKYQAQKSYLFGMFVFNLVTAIVQDNDGCSSTTDKNTWIKRESFSWSMPENLIVGEWWTFDCRLNSNKVSATLWQKTNTNSSQRIPDGKYIKVSDKNMFLISGLKKSDGGRYYCNACGLEKFVGKIHMTAEGEAFAKPNVTKIPNTQISTYGSSLTLVCEVYGQYSIRWYKVGLDEDLMTDEEIVSKKNVNSLTFVIPRATEKDDGIYVCEIQRFIVKYIANNTIVVKSQEGEEPSFSEFNASSEIRLKENDHVSVSYSVSGIPSPNITWFITKNGLPSKQIALCPSNVSHCKLSSWRNEETTKKLFRVLKVEYPADDDITYTSQATNDLGKANKSFTIRVYIKPQLAVVKQRNHIYRKGMQLNCSVEKVNPKMTSFTWEYCDPKLSTCDPKNDSKWEQIHSDYLTTKVVNLTLSLLLEDQPQDKVVYRCKAENVWGADQISYKVYKVRELSDHLTKDSSLIFMSTVIPVGIFSFSIIFVIAFVSCKRIKVYGGLYIFSHPPMPDYIDQLDYNKDVREQIRKLPYVPEWEFPRERVLLHSELGKGEFGSVWLAHASGIAEFRPRDILKQKFIRTRLSVLIRTLRSRNNNYVGGKEVTAVAVKKLKDDSDKEKLVDLQSELKILIHVGEHENIVNLLGACTKGTNYDLWIILEYCANGDLRSFLRRGGNHYEENETSLAVDLSVTFGPRKLIHIALQIAKGMEFLISRKVIHRDLAARNVLLGNGFVAKVADFGLARDVYKYQKYVKKSCTLLPLKWMAIESIQYSVFTEKTDVWSFGVVLWELFKLGQTPYPGISNLDVFTYLLAGERMAIPTRCPWTITELMKQCWENQPDNRPSFAMMVKMLHDYVANERNFQISVNGFSGKEGILC